MSKRADTLSHVRRVRRYVESQNRKNLKRRMNEYNVLSRPSAGAGFHDNESSDTLSDISQNLTDAIHNAHLVNRRSPVSRPSHSDTIVSHVVRDEIRDAWHAKIGMVSLMSDEVRQKLLDQSQPVSLRNMSTDESHEMRERRLSQIARWMVYQWCEGEGYDPDKHPKTK